jgi:hypothetical protein
MASAVYHPREPRSWDPATSSCERTFVCLKSIAVLSYGQSGLAIPQRTAARHTINEICKGFAKTRCVGTPADFTSRKAGCNYVLTNRVSRKNWGETHLRKSVSRIRMLTYHRSTVQHHNTRYSIKLRCKLIISFIQPEG